MKPPLRDTVNKLPLEKFIPAALLILLVFFIFLAGNIYNRTNNYLESIEKVSRAQMLLGYIDEASLTVTQMHLNRRSYIVSADEKYLTEYNNNRNRAGKQFQNLRELIKDDGSKIVFINEMDSLANMSISLLDSSIMAFESVKINNPELQSPLTVNSQDYLEKMILKAGELKEEELMLLKNQQEESNQILANTRELLAATSLFLLIVLGFSFYISLKLIKNKNEAEKLLKKSHEELEDKVEKRTAELKNANESFLNEINNRKKIEKSLKESEERFRLMADSSPVMIWLSDENRQRYYFNKTWFDFTGRTTEQEKGYGWMQNIHPEDVEVYYEKYILAFEKRKPFEIEYRLKDSGGGYRWLLEKGVQRFESNEFAGYIGCCFDIHLRKRNERYAKIQYSVSKILLEFSSMDDALYNVLKIICKDINWKFGILWKVNKNYLIPTSIWSSSSKDFKEYSALYEKDFKIEKGSGIPGIAWDKSKSIWIEDIKNFENFIRKEDAVKMGWVSAIAVPISNGKEVIAVIECFNEQIQTPKDDLLEVLEAVGRQVGNYLERMKAENSLKVTNAELENMVNKRTNELAGAMNKLLGEIENKEKIQSKLKLFAHAIKGVKESVYITDLDNNTIFVNSAFEEIFGYYEEELIGKKMPVLFSEDVDEQLQKEILFKSIRGGWKGEINVRRKDGIQIIIYLSISVIRNDEGKVEALVGICQDITENIRQKYLLIKRNGLLKLLNDVIVITNRSFNVPASISYALNKMCEYTDWDLGHCFYAENGELVSSKMWNANLSHRFINFRNITENLRFLKGEGLPGKCFSAGTPIWEKLNATEDKLKDARFAEANKVGLKTGVWAPVKHGNKVVGILEFFNKDEKEPDNEILDSIINIGVELGSLFERNETLRIIRESEENLRLLIENIKDYAIIRLDINGNIASWNKGAEEINGYSAHEIIGKHFSIFYNDDDIKQNIPQLNLEMAKMNGHFKREGRRVRKDGSFFWADVIITALHDEKGVLYGYSKVTRDVSERREAEEALIESEHRLREAQKIAKLGSWEWDAVNDRVYWSEEMYNIFEVDPDIQITNELYLALLDEENKETRRGAVEKALKDNKPFSYYLKIQTKSGRTKILNSIGEIETGSSNEITRMVGTIIDVTEIKSAEEKIKKSEKQLKVAQQIANLGSWEFNFSTGELECSDEMYRIFEIDKSVDIREPDTFKSFVFTEDLEKVETALEELSDNVHDMELDFRIVTKDGKLKYLANYIRVEFNENSEPVRVFGSTQDITDIKVVEEELRRTNDKLLKTQKELVHNEKLAALGRFSSGIAHEIRNPLANISALAQLLSKAKIDDEKMKKHLNYILINTDIANKIIKDLLNFASPDELVFNSENLKEILTNVIQSVEPRCLENKILISNGINIEDPETQLDKTRLENAILNFISNSIDAMPEGGNLSINAKTDKDKKRVIIDIIDSGEGISPENLDKIFEPFFTTKESGTGLGLGLAYQTIILHQGILNIFSEPGKGTHVEIKLPIKKSTNGENINN